MKSREILISVLAPLVLCPAVAAAIRNVAVSGTTSTQAVLRYTAPGPAACTVQVSESAAMQPLVHDVDPALFPQENLDSRSGSLSSGSARVFVVGKRRADRGADSHWYSRALQAYTLHYFQITCGTDQASGTFSTTNIPLGNTYNEDLPPDPNASTTSYFVAGGQYAWPEFTNWVNTTGRSEEVIDPQTGMLLKRVTMPQDQPTGNGPAGDHSFATAIDVDGVWTNPAGVLADDASAATFTGAGSDWLFLRDEKLNFGDSYPLESMTFSVKGWCTGACAGDNAKIQACITVNGVSCWPNNANTIDIALGTTANTSVFALAGSTVPILSAWTPAGYSPLVRTDLQPITGQVNVDMSGHVTWVSGSTFYMNWTAGSRITIAGSECQLTGPAAAESLTINVGSCSPALWLPQTQANYSAGNFGFLVRKKTSSTDAISLQYAKYTITTSVLVSWPASGSPLLCSDTLTEDTVSGEMGYRCVIPGGVPMVYWVDHVTGDAHHLGPLGYAGAAGTNGFESGWCNNASTTLTGGGPTDPETLYCTGTDLSGNEVLLGCTLTSNNEPGNLQVTCSNLTPASTSSDLLSLVQQFTSSDSPSFNRQVFQSCGLVGLQNGRLVMGCSESQQDTLGWVVIFDPAAAGTSPGCVGGGLPGCVIAASSSWSTSPARWCVLHTVFVAGDADSAWVAGKFLGASPGLPGSGPYVSTVVSGSLSGTPAIAQGTGGCPANSNGCDIVTVDGEPCNPNPVSIDAGNCPKNPAQAYLQQSQPGDVFSLTANGYERVLLLSKSGNQWLLQRGYGNSGVIAHSGSLVLSPACMAQRFDVSQSNNSWIWDYLNDPHGLNASGNAMRVLYDYDHPLPRPNVVIGGAPWFDPNDVGGYAVLNGTGFGNPNTYPALGPPFASVTGVTPYIEASQDHASHPQDDVSANAAWFLDARPAASLGPSLVDQATWVSGQLYKFTSVTSDGDNLAQIGGPNAYLGGVNRKEQATMAFCGTQPMLDISSPAAGNAIGDSAADSYHYCVARNAGECRGGSARGDIYLNCPYPTPRQDGTYGCGGVNDMCVYNTGAYLNGVNQIGYQASDVDGKLGRLLTKGLLRQRLNDYNQNVRTLPDASWLLFRIMALSGALDEIVVGKLPPFPGLDSASRGTFVPVALSLTPPRGLGVNNAIVEFGYLENGSPRQLYCTSRRETCVAAAATPGAIPFYFASEGAGGAESGIAGLSCANGCSIGIPALPQRIVYYKVKYRDANNRVVAQTGIQAAVAP